MTKNSGSDFWARLKPVETTIMAVILMASLTVWGLGQDFINVNNGHGWDGHAYFDTAKQIRAGGIEVIIPPQGYRLGQILIAAYAPIDNLLYSFYYTNLVLAVVGGLLLAVWLHLKVRTPVIRILAIFIYAWSTFGPLRFTTFYPANIEPITFVLIMLNFLVIEIYLRNRNSSWYAAIVLLAVIGSLTRELALMPVAALAFANIKLNLRAFYSLPNFSKFLSELLSPFLVRDRIKLYLPLAFGISGMLIIQMIIPETYPFSFINHAAYGWTQTNDLRVIVAYLASMGPIVLVVLFRPAFLFSWFSRRPFYTAYIIIFLLLCYTNLPDERYFIYIMPLIFLPIEATLRKHFLLNRDFLFWLMAFAFTGVAIRSYTGLPPHGIEFPLLPWWREALCRFIPQSGDLFSIWIYLAEPKTVIATFLVFVIMAWLLWIRAERFPSDKIAEDATTTRQPNSD